MVVQLFNRNNNNRKKPNAEPSLNKKDDMLCSWKEIAGYVKRDIRTCFRWTKELGFPVQKYQADSKKSKVWAQRSEIDKWFDERKNNHNHIKNSKSKLDWIKIIIISSLVLAMIFFAFLYIKAKRDSSALKIMTVAVFPFDELNSNEYNDYFRLGLTEEIADYLASHGRFRIIPIYSVPDYKSWLARSSLAVADLGVDFVLRGTINRTLTDVAIQLQLTRAESSTVIFEHEFKDELKNVHIIKKNILDRLVSELQIQLPIVTFSRSWGLNESEAFDSYLKGKYILNKIKTGEQSPINLYYQGNYYRDLGTKESNEFAIELFSRAIEADKNFSQAYVGLAQCYMNYANYSWDHNIKWLDKALQLLNYPVLHKDEFPEYFSSLSTLYLIKYLTFDKETKELAFSTISNGVLKYPNDPVINALLGYWYFLEFGELGNQASWNSALEYGEKSFWQNPFSVSKNIFYTELLLLEKMFDEAHETCSFLNKIDYSKMSEYRTAEIYYYSEKFDQAENIFQKFEEPLNFKIGALFYLGMIAAQKEDHVCAKTVLNQIQHLSPGILIECELRTASIYFGLNNEKQGFRNLDMFFDKPITTKMKYYFGKYIELDPNFNLFQNKIRRKYFDSKHLN